MGTFVSAWAVNPCIGRYHTGSRTATTEQPVVVFGGDAADLPDRHLSQGGNSLGHMGHPARLVLLAPVRHRRQKGRIGFDQQPVGGHPAATSCTVVAFLKLTMPDIEM